MRKMKLGVLASGRGSNLQSILDHIDQGKLDAEISIVLSDKEDSFALKRAGERGIYSNFFLRKNFANQEDFEKAFISALKDSGVELVILAGFMRVLSPLFIQSFPNCILNIHPSILPSFQGLHAHRQALEYGVKFSGCTVHFVNEEVDGGPIILQAVVPVLEDDTEESLSERILKEEHRIFPAAIQQYIQGDLVICGRKIMLKKGDV